MRRRIAELSERLRLAAERGGIYIVSMPSLEQVPRIWEEILAHLGDEWQHRLIDASVEPDILARQDVLTPVHGRTGTVVGVVPAARAAADKRAALLTALNVRRELVFQNVLALVLFVDPDLERELPAHAKDFYAMRGAHLRIALEGRGYGLGEPPGLGAARERIEWLKKEIAAAKSTGSPKVRADLLQWLGSILSLTGQGNEAGSAYRKALALHREIGDRQGEANQLCNLGNVYQVKGELDEAARYYREALALHREIGDRQGEANQLGNLGIVYRVKGELDEAARYYREALALDREIGNRQGEANQLGNLWNVYQVKGELDEAERYYREALALD
ncbi:MAG: tetratricopeptide repeat protein, partial [Gemmatimonadetes bacterium]|nr:tetratricopeptide repeat protein [Gemmatimonadota bacterium]